MIKKAWNRQRDGPEPSDESSAPLYSVSAVFGETELRQMSGVLDAVCEKLNIGRNSPDARAAALAILHQTSQGYNDVQALKDAVIASLSQATLKTPA